MPRARRRSCCASSRMSSPSARAPRPTGLAEMADDLPDDGKSRNVGVLRRLIALLRPHKARFLLAVLTLLAASLIALIYPWAAKYAVDAGLGDASPEQLDRVVMLLVGV